MQAEAGKAAQPPAEFPLDSIPPQQLVQIKQSLEQEVHVLGQSLEQFKLAIVKYEENKQILETISKKAEQENPMIIPLTSSLFVTGVMHDKQTVTVDLGTGYFVEKNFTEASEFCDRKIALLKENIEKVTKIIQLKSQRVDQITISLQKKMSAYVAAQKAAQQQK